MDALRANGFQVARLYDYQWHGEYKGIAVNAPEHPFMLQPNEIMVIGTVHDYQIRHILHADGLQEGQHYFRLVDFLRR